MRLAAPELSVVWLVVLVQNFLPASAGLVPLRLHVALPGRRWWLSKQPQWRGTLQISISGCKQVTASIIQDTNVVKMVVSGAVHCLSGLQSYSYARILRRAVRNQVIA